MPACLLAAVVTVVVVVLLTLVRMYNYLLFGDDKLLGKWSETIPAAALKVAIIHARFAVGLSVHVWHLLSLLVAFL